MLSEIPVINKVIDNIIKESTEYRVNFLASIMVIVLPLIFVFLLWDTIFAERVMIGSYSRDKILTYYILSILIQDLLYTGPNYEIANDIREGKLSGYLIKPYNYLLHSLGIKIGTNIPYLITTLLIIFIYVSIFLRTFFFQLNLVNIVMFLISTLLAFILSFLITFTLSISAFWLDEISSIDVFSSAIIPILNGALLPLSLFPEFWLKVFSFLPFKYLLFFPIDVYLGNLTLGEVYWGLFIQVLWILFFFLSAVIIWRQGLKRYQAYGG